MVDMLCGGFFLGFCGCFNKKFRRYNEFYELGVRYFRKERGKRFAVIRFYRLLVLSSRIE